MMKNVIKLIFLLFDLVIGCCVLLHAQVDEKLKADIVSTGYVHSPLPLDETKAFETFGLKKKVLETVMLCDMEDFSKWSHKGIGKIGLTDERASPASTVCVWKLPPIRRRFLAGVWDAALAWPLMI